MLFINARRGNGSQEAISKHLVVSLKMQLKFREMVGYIFVFSFKI